MCNCFKLFFEAVMSKFDIKHLMLVLIGVFSGQAAFASDSCQDNLPPILSGVIRLPRGCVYHHPIAIISSNTSLDCSGSIFDGEGQDKVGLYIDSRGEHLADVMVKNCTFKNFKNGVSISWKTVDVEKGSDRNEIYKRSPTRITLDNLNVKGNERVGVYVDDYSTRVIIKNSIIERNKGVGIYLEHSSRNNEIVNNKFIENGFGDGRREAIAVDSSAENLISGNYFQGNSAGGIFLYKNCGEHIDSGRQVVRWQHSSDNKIRNNTFVNEDVGVWLASRQSRNLKRIGCADKPMDVGGNFFEDYASNNFVVNNKFIKNKVGVRIESDDNEITRNVFECDGKTAVDMPRTKREELLNRPQIGNVIRENTELRCKK